MGFTKRTEFRIGNWVADENGYYQIEAEHLEEECFNTLQCWGIEINDIILKQLGFMCHTTSMVPKLSGEVTNYFLDGLEMSTAQSMFWRWHGGYAIDNIKYVHQLQNLYFALTGKELVFNPETLLCPNCKGNMITVDGECIRCGTVLKIDKNSTT